MGAFFACGGHLGFSQVTMNKKLETTFSVFIETVGSEKFPITLALSVLAVNFRLVHS